jgi:hypothetical protein
MVKPLLFRGATSDFIICATARPSPIFRLAAWQLAPA